MENNIENHNWPFHVSCEKALSGHSAGDGRFVKQDPSSCYGWKGKRKSKHSCSQEEIERVIN